MFLKQRRFAPTVRHHPDTCSRSSRTAVRDHRNTHPRLFGQVMQIVKGGNKMKAYMVLLILIIPSLLLAENIPKNADSNINEFLTLTENTTKPLKYLCQDVPPLEAAAEMATAI